jgi:hypothetical protein
VARFGLSQKVAKLKRWGKKEGAYNPSGDFNPQGSPRDSRELRKLSSLVHR